MWMRVWTRGNQRTPSVSVPGFSRVCFSQGLSLVSGPGPSGDLPLYLPSDYGCDYIQYCPPSDYGCDYIQYTPLCPFLYVVLEFMSAGRATSLVLSHILNLSVTQFFLRASGAFPPFAGKQSHLMSCHLCVLGQVTASSQWEAGEEHVCGCTAGGLHCQGMALK